MSPSNLAIMRPVCPGPNEWIIQPPNSDTAKPPNSDTFVKMAFYNMFERTT
jgi:hypothetical protein